MSNKIEISEDNLSKLIDVLERLTKEVATLVVKQNNPVQYIYHYQVSPSYPVSINPYPNYPSPYITTCAGGAGGITTYTG